MSNFTREQLDKRNIIKRRFRDKRRQMAIDLLGGKCVECGTTKRLEFDHINVDRVDDRHVITRLISDTSWATVLEELKKCQLLCNSCHWEKTRRDFNYNKYEHGTVTCYRATACRCDDCRNAHSSYLREYRSKLALTTIVL